MSLIFLIPSPKDESVEVEDIGVGRSSSDRLVTFEASDSVSELSLSRLLHRKGHGQPLLSPNFYQYPHIMLRYL